jgi:ABC-type transport system substrate-binding protein
MVGNLCRTSGLGLRYARTPHVVIGVALSLCVLACAPTATPERSQGAALQAAAPVPNRTMVMIARGEPGSLAVKTLLAAGGVGNANPLFNATLDHADERGGAHPYLAEALPVLNTDTWRVLPDGRMETIHRLKPNLSWHDGTPLSADDFVFAWRVYATPVLGVAGSVPINQMEQVIAPDDRTIVIQWRQTYPEAGTLRETFQALPRHILQGPFQQADSEAFANHPFWTNEYVGLGPYRLERWEPGTAIEARAFTGHALGQPRIERLSLLFMADPNAAVARLLSGDAHIAIDAFLMYEQGAILQREWGPRNGGTVLYSPILYRNSHIQLRPEMVSTRALLDVRVRRSLAHAIDKNGVNDALMGGTAIVTDSLLSPLADYYPAIDRAITKYPFDLRRAQQLLEEAGLSRGGDGFLVDPQGEPFKLDVRTLANPQHESENAIIVECFGASASTRRVSSSRSRSSAMGRPCPRSRACIARAPPAAMVTWRGTPRRRSRGPRTGGRGTIAVPGRTRGTTRSSMPTTARWSDPARSSSSCRWRRSSPRSCLPSHISTAQS